MQIYIIINFVMLIATLMGFATMVYFYRHLMIKPSMIVLAFYHIQIQWAGTLYSDYIYDYLPNPYEYVILLHGFPLISLVISLMTFRVDALKIYRRVKNEDFVISSKAIVILSAISLFILLYYLSVVPLQSTGLYSILFNPSLATHMREESLAALNDIYVKYGYTFLRAVFLPLLAVMFFHRLVFHWKERKLPQTVICILSIVMIMLAAMLPGDRSAAALILLSIIFSILIKKGFPLKLHYILIAGIFILAIPVMITILREGKEISVSLMIDYMQTGIFKRVFVVPFETGLWHAHYAQINGFFGIGGISKLAALYGIEPINISNLIYLLYTPAYIPTGTANTSFIFTYYSMFGLPSLFLSIFCLTLLDSVIFIFRYLPNSIMIPAIAACYVSSFKFISSDYTTTLLTGGYLVIPIITVILMVLLKIKLNINKKERA